MAPAAGARARRLAPLALLALAAPGAAVRSEAPEDLVNVLVGTNTQDGSSISDGNVLPIIKRPHGFNDWAPQTDASASSWWFKRNDKTFEGIRCTHQPSPWIGDYGHFVVQPHYGLPGALQHFSPQDSTFRPYYFGADVEEPGADKGSSRSFKVEWTATNHAALGRVTFKDKAPASITLSIIEGALKAEGAVITGTTKKNSGGVPPNWRGMFIVVKALSPVANSSATPLSASFSVEAGSEPVVLALATSFISQAQAELNLKEVESLSFDEAVDQGRQEWRSLLQTVDVDCVNDDRLAVFYTNLWRANLFPRFLQETDASGKEQHYSPYTDKVLPGISVTDSGFWDSYRTVYVLQSIMNPKKLAALAEGWVNAYQEADWLPTWPSPGQRSSMTGTMGDFVLADAIAKNAWGIVPEFNVSGAYEAIRKDAFVEPPKGSRFGRAGLKAYIEKGYVPESEFGFQMLGAEAESESVTRTQNYYLSDAAISRAADILGFTEDRDTLFTRSQQYPVLFNSESFFFQPKDTLGAFYTPFDPLAWRDGFTESGGWQYRFYVPHDVEGLKDLYSGQLCESIEAMMTHTTGDAYHVGGYGNAIHEMKELAAIQPEFGLYAHNNQPVHHVLWVAKKAGCDAVADKYLRKANLKLYTIDGWSGDEDNGEMASWHVLSSLGIYSLEGAKDELVIGSPSVVGATLALPNGKTLVVTTKNQGEANVYVDKVTWTGQDGKARVLTDNVLPYTSLMAGGTLAFELRGEAKAAGRASSFLAPGGRGRKEHGLVGLFETPIGLRSSVIA